MKKIIIIPAIVFSGLLISCQKNTESLQEAKLQEVNANNKTICQVDPPKEKRGMRRKICSGLRL